MKTYLQRLPKNKKLFFVINENHCFLGIRAVFVSYSVYNPFFTPGTEKNLSWSSQLFKPHITHDFRTIFPIPGLNVFGRGANIMIKQFFTHHAVP